MRPKNDGRGLRGVPGGGGGIAEASKGCSDGDSGVSGEKEMK